MKNKQDNFENYNLKKLLDGQLTSSLQLTQFLQEKGMGEELQDLVQCYVYDLIDWLRINSDAELKSSPSEPLVLLGNKTIDDIEKAFEGIECKVPVSACA